MINALYRGTTPVFTIDFEGFTGESIRELWVTFQQEFRDSAPVVLEKSYKDITGTELSVTLTQEETLMFTAGIGIQAQVRALLNGGKAIASPIKTVQIGAILKDGVVEYED